MSEFKSMAKTQEAPEGWTGKQIDEWNAALEELNLPNAAEWYRQSVVEMETARDALWNAIMKEHEGGMSTREIAKWAGISHQRVHQIVQTDAAGKRVPL